MARFSFQAKTTAGKLVKGTVEAGSDSEARVKIRAQKLIILKLIPMKGESSQQGKTNKSNSEKVKPKELQIFTRQFAVLIGAGVPVVQSLEAMLGGGKSPVLSKVLQKIVEDLEQGKRLADAMGFHPNVFDSMYVNLVKAGEEGGVLDEVLVRLADYIEKSVKLKRKIMGALWYPAAIIVVAVIVITAILVFVIPNFVDMFQQSGNELPTLTQWVINASDWVRAKWYIVVTVLVGAPFALRMYYGTPEGKKSVDSVLIDVPIFGPLIQKGAIARFSRTLSTLLSAGIRIMDSIEISSATAGNYVIQEALSSAKESISKGGTLRDPLRKSKYIPDMVSQMISVGEDTGHLDSMLGKVADFYEDEVETTAEAMTSMIEPLLMVVLGGIIAVLVVAMYLPIFGMAGAIGGG